MPLASITAPFSCGVYLAGTIRTKISGLHVSGQEDTADGTRPKAAIAVNGAVEWTLDNCTFADNYIDIVAVGPSADVNGYTYAADMGAVVSNCIGHRAGSYGVSIVHSGTKALSGGVKFVGCKFLGCGDSAVAMFPTATLAISNITFENCELGGTNYGVNFNRGGTVSHSSTGMVVSGGKISAAGTKSIRGLGFNTGGTIKVAGVSFTSAPQIHIEFESMDSLAIVDNLFHGAASTANMYLDGCKGTLRGNVAANGSTQVFSGTGSLGRAIPTWTGYNGVYVENAVTGLTGTTPNAYRLKGWGWVSGTTWYEDRTGLQ